MRERELEYKFVDACRTIGILQRKARWVTTRGCPDRIVIHNGIVAFVELKAPGQRPALYQLREHDRLRKAGADVFVVDDIKSLNRFLIWICREV